VLVLLAPPAVFGVVVVVVAEPSGLAVVEVAEPAGAPGVGVVLVVDVVAELSAAGAAAVEVSSAFLLQPARPRLSATITAPAVSSPVCGSFDMWQVSLDGERWVEIDPRTPSTDGSPIRFPFS
jgi:hypothetical protein